MPPRATALPRSHNTEFWSALCTEHWLVENHRVAVTKQGIQAAPSSMSLASLATVSSAASLSSLGGGVDSAGDDGEGDEDGELDEEALAEKQRKREEKLRKAADKAAKMELKKKLKFARRWVQDRAGQGVWVGGCRGLGARSRLMAWSGGRNGEMGQGLGGNAAETVVEKGSGWGAL